MKQFIDLGLPSGLLWADTNEEGYFTFNEAKGKFGDNVPSIKEWKELQENCKWEWNKEKNGCYVIGRNGNSIFLPALGYRGGASLYNSTSRGNYWSSSPFKGNSYDAQYVSFDSFSVCNDSHYHYYRFSVRLVQRVINKKDMDYKKKYDEMVEKVKEFHKEGNALTKAQMEIILPELAESEDEKIRKMLIERVRTAEELNEELREWIIAYLEKQKGPADGDFARGYDCGYECCLHSHGAEWFERQKEQKDYNKLYEDIAKSKWFKKAHEGKSLGCDYEQKEQQPNIELIKRSWYMEGYTDGKFKREPMWNLKTGEGGPRYEKNEKYGQPLEQNPAEWSEEDEKIRKGLIQHLKELREWKVGTMSPIKVKGHYDAWIAYLEKQNEQKPILEVFGFKVGDAVRLKDGDGRKHIIKSFEKIEGIHGPDFYDVEFEDNSASDGIFPGEEYPNGYYTHMVKFEEEPKPVEWEWPNLSNCIKNCKKCHGKCCYRKEPYEEQKPAEEGLFDREKMIKGLIDGITNLASPSNYGDSITFGGFNWKDCVAYLEKLNSENVKKYTFTDMQESYKRGHLRGEEVGREQMMIEIQRDHDGEEWINPDDFTAHIRQAYQDGFREGAESVKSAEWSEDIIRKAVKEVGLTQHQIDWFKTNVFPPKQEWSEEDEDKMTFLEKLIEHNVPDDEYGFPGGRSVAKSEAISMLKSLRPQPHWKPIEEQMDALNEIINTLAASKHPHESDYLFNILNGLKKNLQKLL